MEERKAIEMLSEMIANTEIRIPNDAKCMSNRNPLELARMAVMGLRLAITRFTPMTASAIKIGEMIGAGCEGMEGLEKKKLKVKEFRMGYHLLHVMAENKLIDIRKGTGARDKYMITVRNEDFVTELIGELEELSETVKTVAEVQFEAPEPFTRFWHPVAGKMVRKGHKDLYKEITVEKTPKLFEVINKLMATPYSINEDLLEVFKQSLGDDVFTFADLLLNDRQRSSKEDEQERVLDLASNVGSRTFYQHMFYDWRGRIYPSTAYLNSSASKLAKSLIKIGVDEAKPIQNEGYFFLLVHAANTFGYDKDTIDGRYDFADANLDEWLDWAKNPFGQFEKIDEETGEVTMHYNWTKADDPFNFLAAIMEIKKAHAHVGGPYDYPSSLLIAWDASCSGLQVLSALSKDRKSAEMCNLTDSDERGDYYKMIANEVWKDCANLTPEEVEEFDEIQVEIAMYEDAIEDAHLSKDKELIEEAYAARKVWSKANGKRIYVLSKVFWGREILKDQRRNICKRPCMTYFYSCGEGTMADSLYSDFSSKKDFKGMNKVFCLWLSKRIFKACETIMDKPTELMKLFIEMAISDYDKGDDFTLTAPFTEFPMVQRYTMDDKVQVKVKYKGDEIKPQVIISSTDKVDFSKVKTGASPNTVHMLDAVVLAKIVSLAEYDMVCIHDSFSAVVGDASKLFEDTRTAFATLFTDDLLSDLMAQKEMVNEVKYGSLKIEEVYANEQCFS